MNRLGYGGRRWLPVVACIALAFAACGDDDGEDSSNTTVSPAATTAQATTTATGESTTTAGSAATTGAPATTAESATTAAACTQFGDDIVIAAVGTVEGAAVGNSVQQHDAVKVWTDMINDQGGIGCHKVKFISKDDGGDPVKHLQILQDMVENEGVVAFVGSSASTAGSGGVDYINSKHIPVVGGQGGEYWMSNDPYYFKQMSIGEGLIFTHLAGSAKEALAMGKSKFGLMACEYASCSQGLDLWNRVAASLGIEVVASMIAPLAAPDYLSQCLELKNKGAEVVQILMTNANVISIAQSCEQQDYHPIFAFGSTIADPTQLPIDELEGSLIANTVFVPGVTDAEGVAEFDAAMAEYAPDAAPSNVHAVGWVAAKLFEAGARAATDPTDPASLLDALWAIQNNDLGGLTFPLSFDKEKGTPDDQGCYLTVTITDHQFASIGDGKIACTPIPA